MGATTICADTTERQGSTDTNKDPAHRLILGRFREAVAEFVSVRTRFPRSVRVAGPQK